MSTVHINVYAHETDNDGCLKQSKCRWWPFKTVKFQIHGGSPSLKLLWVSKNLVTDIFPSQRIIYNNINIYSTQSKSISVVVLL